MRAFDSGVLLLRVVSGLTLAAHGYPKLFGGAGRQAPKPLLRALGGNYAGAIERGGIEGFAQNLEKMNVPSPKAAAFASALTEVGGGLALALGLATPAVAAAVTFNMLVAVRKVHWKSGFYGAGGFEFPLLLGLSAAAIGLMGPGAFSVDAALRRRLRGR